MPSIGTFFCPLQLPGVCQMPEGSSWASGPCHTLAHPCTSLPHTDLGTQKILKDQWNWVVGGRQSLG